MQEKPHRTNKERSKVTRAALIAAARDLFVEKGFAKTGTPEIVRAAKVTRGALYHHFGGKADLFRAVVEGEAQAVKSRIAQDTRASGSAADALMAGSDAYFSAMTVPGRVRLLLLDGPSVLGPATMSEIDRHYGGDALRKGLISALEGDLLDEATLNALADVVSAAFDRAALAISEGNPARNYEAAIRRILNGVVARI